jgi:addiction module HigA family antidote
MLPKFRKPIHPGTILWEEFLLPRNITQQEFVNHLGGTWTQPKLSAIIHGKRAVTEAIALDLADALGTTSQFWINLQNAVNLWHAMRNRRKVKPYPISKVKIRSNRLRRLAH